MAACGSSLSLLQKHSNIQQLMTSLSNEEVNSSTVVLSLSNLLFGPNLSPELFHHPGLLQLSLQGVQVIGQSHFADALLQHLAAAESNGNGTV